MSERVAASVHERFHSSLLSPTEDSEASTFPPVLLALLSLLPLLKLAKPFGKLGVFERRLAVLVGLFQTAAYVPPTRRVQFQIVLRL